MNTSMRNKIWLTLQAWLSMLGFDFFIHGGVLAGIYLEGSPFLLSLEDATRLIPLGYFSFLLLAILLTWLMDRLDVSGWMEGLGFGFKLGLLTAASMVLGLLSITTAQLSLMAGWFVGQLVEMSVAGAVLGAGMAGMSLKKLLGYVTVYVIFLFILTVILQSVGVFPTPVV